MRTLILCAILFGTTCLGGCGSCTSGARVSTKLVLKTVVVDETAAFPSQEPGTRPPVLPCTFMLTEDQLHESWVQLFDGVSTYGWEVVEGDAELSVRSRNNDRLLFCDVRGSGAVFRHRFSDNRIEHAKGKTVCGSSPFGVIHYDTSANISIDLRSGKTESVADPNPVFSGVRAKPNNPVLLGENDWKAPVGESTVVWEDGEMELVGGSGYVESAREYGDFVLQLEYLTMPGINSGVFFRCIPGEKMNGYECQIFNNPPAEDYEKYLGTDTGGIFRRYVGRNIGPDDGQWNYLTIAVRGPMVATWVNGIQTVDWEDSRAEDDNPRKGLRLKPGTIQLQGHDPGTKIRFRNMRIATLEER